MKIQGFKFEAQTLRFGAREMDQGTGLVNGVIVDLGFQEDTKAIEYGTVAAGFCGLRFGL